MSDDATWAVRVTGDLATGAVALVRSHRVQIGEPISFDDEHPRPTALELLLSAVGAELVVGLQRACARQRLPLDAIEAAVTARLEHPLAYLGVVGEEGAARIDPIVVTVFASTEAPREDLMAIWERLLPGLPISRAIRSALSVELTLRIGD